MKSIRNDSDAGLCLIDATRFTGIQFAKKQVQENEFEEDVEKVGDSRRCDQMLE